MCPEYDLPDNDTGAVHNALADAKWNKKVYDRLVEVAGPYVNFEL
jgi:hypothetical protein